MLPQHLNFSFTGNSKCHGEAEKVGPKCCRPSGGKTAGGNVFRIKVTRGTARQGTLDSRIAETEQMTEQKTGPKSKLINEGMRCRVGLMREMH